MTLYELDYNLIFEDKNNVCTVLDGDKKEKTTYKDKVDIFFSPFVDIEDYVLECFSNKEFGDFSKVDLKKKYNIQNKPGSNKYSKAIYNMIKKNIKTETEIFEFISSKKEEEVETFKNQLLAFLN